MPGNQSTHFESSLSSFVKRSPDEILGRLTSGLAKVGFDSVEALQIDSWSALIRDLQMGIETLLSDHADSGSDKILIEYTVPVIRRRIDVVLLHEDKIVVIEYKQGSSTSASSALRQAQDYALDLQDFHELSRGAYIIPIALGEFESHNPAPIDRRGKAISPTILATVLKDVYSTKSSNGFVVNQEEWASSRYFPVPPVVEAAVAAFNQHAVDEIAISRSDPESLKRSERALVAAVKAAQERHGKVLCVLTGVPGAGKTLAGLNAVAGVQADLRLASEQAVYLSGNTPLVNVIREALYRDRKRRDAELGRKNKETTKARMESIIQEMHRFVADHYESHNAPVARMLVFDEAQRAWSKDRNRKKFGRDISEPAMVLDIMNRIDGWAVVVALVGGGQEIHDGEAGLEEWGSALSAHPSWSVWTSEAAMKGGPSVAGSRLFAGSPSKPVRIHPDLHLDVSMRSIDAEQSAAWVNAMLAGDTEQAQSHAQTGLPIYVCRSLQIARNWLRLHQLGTRRTGLVASSGAERLRGIGIETPTFSFMRGIDYVRWFLEPAGDVRSSNQLEVALSEFEVQGLELDYVGLIWGGDLVLSGGRLMVRKFKGTRWSAESSPRAVREGLNRYRVLLTRYRKAMAICIPQGDEGDPTRAPSDFDSVLDYLLRCGAQLLPAKAGTSSE